jgi:hypothetical protein
MGYSNPDLQREFNRKWVAARRAAWFAGKQCVKCGSTESLELDHIDPATKVSHSIWSWTAERREAELAKCQVLCRKCHQEKSLTENIRGEDCTNAKLTEADVREILQSGLPGAELGRQFNVSRETISSIRLGHTWRHIPR